MNKQPSEFKPKKPAPSSSGSSGKSNRSSKQARPHLPSFGEIIDELNHISDQIHKTCESVKREYKATTEAQPYTTNDASSQRLREVSATSRPTQPSLSPTSWWTKVERFLASLETRMYEDQEIEDTASQEQDMASNVIPMNEKERLKIVKRRKQLRERIRQFSLIPLHNKESTATEKLDAINKNDPILNIAERILLNLCTDTKSTSVLSIQQAKAEGIITKDTTPFSYPHLAQHSHKPPYYIANAAIIALYEILNTTALRETLSTQGNFLETEEMIVASQLELYVPVEFNRASKRIELSTDNLYELESATILLAQRRKQLWQEHQKRNSHSKWFKWIK